jgi:hypothetical protein
MIYLIMSQCSLITYQGGLDIALPNSVQVGVLDSLFARQSVFTHL